MVSGNSVKEGCWESVFCGGRHSVLESKNTSDGGTRRENAVGDVTAWLAGMCRSTDIASAVQRVEYLALDITLQRWCPIARQPHKARLGSRRQFSQFRVVDQGWRWRFYPYSARVGDEYKMIRLCQKLFGLLSDANIVADELDKDSPPNTP
ncbi:hypothetical protein BDZ89DRAFT_555819 [Hymenopellis radicata]|nr:hypothetical protein BDZ89DRAFT_555819 [Hymenopellis radicata]